MKSTILERAEKGEVTLIAEIGVNYYDIARELGITPMEAAKKMVDEAAGAGIHAVKFQSYKADTLAAKVSPYYWDINEEPTRSQYELFKKFDAFGEEEYRELSEYCNQAGIEFFSTAFDFESADYLASLMGIYKISSSDLTNLPFIRYQAKKNCPILLSTGASEPEEIDAALQVIHEVSNQPVVLMHCVLEYPTPYEHTNLKRILTLKKRYPELMIGYSDHTKPTDCADVIKTAYLFGALIIEKHFTLDKTLKGNDHYHAMDPADAKNILNGIKHLQTICGTGQLTFAASEQPARKNARRSIVASIAIPKGTVITEEMLTFKRPASGISPSRIAEVIGKTASKDIEEDTILQYDMIQ